MSSSIGTLYIVATPIGNLDDITTRALNVLNGVDWVACEDTRHSRKLFDHFGIQTKLIPCHEHNEEKQANKLVQSLAAGQQGALISDAGTPLISDPGYSLLNAALKAKVAVVPIPGPSALITALSAAGLPTNRFTFLGFLPQTSSKRQQLLRHYAHSEDTLIFYEAPHRIKACLEDVSTVMGAREVVLARELTKKYESFYRGSVVDINTALAVGDIPEKGEIVVMVAGQDEVVAEPVTSAQIDACLKAGLSTKSAAALLHTLTQQPKKEIYNQILQHKA